LPRVAAAVIAALAVAAVPQSAGAAGPPPLFQLPFPCGESWHLTTYGTHGDYGIDMFANSGTTNNRPILASYSGTIAYAGWDSGGGNIVKINHGGGWRTLYLHMIAPPMVGTGQSVAAGQQLGRVGHTGANTSPVSHLHYGQIADGRKVESYFNGVPSRVTSDGNPNTGPLYIGGPNSSPATRWPPASSGGQQHPVSTHPLHCLRSAFGHGRSRLTACHAAQHSRREDQVGHSPRAKHPSGFRAPPGLADRR
jgi:murein DD-endopeptidase MepM/ murein hydrolase activator NlpD